MIWQKEKARLILLNKSDLASESVGTMPGQQLLKAQGFFVVKLDSRARGGMKEVQAVIQEACKEKTERDRRRGIINRPVRAMVVGIPNVGKSTFINSFAGRACAKTGNRPGVTKRCSVDSPQQAGGASGYTRNFVAQIR